MGACARAAMVSLIGLAITAQVSAAQGDGLRVGYVSPAKVSSEAPQAEAARVRLEEEFAPRDEKIVAMQNKLESLRQRLNSQRRSDNGGVDRQQLQRRIVKLRRDIERRREAFREDFNMRRNEALGELQERIIDTVKAFAEEEGFDLILSEGVIHASDAVNVTDRIIERLRRQHQRNNGE
jgi:outer membrane protein